MAPLERSHRCAQLGATVGVNQLRSDHRRNEIVQGLSGILGSLGGHGVHPNGTRGPVVAHQRGGVTRSAGASLPKDDVIGSDETAELLATICSTTSSSGTLQCSFDPNWRLAGLLVAFALRQISQFGSLGKWQTRCALSGGMRPFLGAGSSKGRREAPVRRGEEGAGPSAVAGRAADVCGYGTPGGQGGGSLTGTSSPSPSSQSDIRELTATSRSPEGSSVSLDPTLSPTPEVPATEAALPFLRVRS